MNPLTNTPALRTNLSPQRSSIALKAASSTPMKAMDAFTPRFGAAVPQLTEQQKKTLDDSIHRATLRSGPKDFLALSFQDASGTWPAATREAALIYVAQAFPQAKSLSLSNTQITDSELRHLASFANLEHLSLCNTPVKGSGLGNLPTSLKNLDLSNTKVSDDALRNLNHLTGLEKLALEYGEERTPSGLASGLARLSSLEELKLSFIGADTLKTLQGLLPNLEIISI